MERTEIYNQFEELNKRASQGGGIDKIEKQQVCKSPLHQFRNGEKTNSR